MSNIIFVIFLFSFLHLTESFKCGSNKFEENIANSVVELNCKGQKALINKCCLEHDRCYDRQAPRKNCDQEFCECLQAASKGNNLCQALGTSHMCNVVKLFGQTAYNNAKKNNLEKTKKVKKFKNDFNNEIVEESINKKKKSKGKRKQTIENILKKEETEEEEIINTTEKL